MPPIAAGMPPILHLSIPVHDMAAARAFYVDTLGCRVGRTSAGFTDVWFYGMQVTLQDRPDENTGQPDRGSRHFGVTLARDEFEDTLARLDERGVAWVSPVSNDDVGKPTEQTKAKIADPSGNVIEFKTYPHVAEALGFSADS